MKEWIRDLPYAVIDMYDEMIDSCYPAIEVFGVDRLPSVVFKQVDPIMYEMGLSEYLDQLEEDGYWSWDENRILDPYEEEE
mgnify:FL=1